MENENDRVRVNRRNGTENGELEPATRGISGSPQSVVADGENTSPRRERTLVDSSGTKDPSSPPSSSGPMKIGGTEAELESSPSFWDTVSRTFGTTDGHLSGELLLQVTRALPNVEQHDPQGNYALSALHGIGPRDTHEGMLATQKVATHNQIMEFLSRAALKEQSPAGVELNLNLATKLQRTFLAQMEALDRHRGKGEQKMNVEHVHIHDGAQAVVGPVRHQGFLDAAGEDDGKSS